MLLRICSWRAILPGLFLVFAGAGPVMAADPMRMTTSQLANWIDEQFESSWEKSQIQPPPLVDDATFLKRVFLDLCGTIPSVSQAREFFEYTGDQKRAVLVERLLNDRRRPEKYAERTATHWATLWRRMMVPGNSPEAQMAAGLEPWLKEQFLENVSYDQFARKIVTANSTDQAQMAANPRGGMMAGGPALLYQAAGGKPASAASSITRMFLGIRIGCAECHDHPFADWKQEDFWGMAAFFNGVANGVVADSASTKIRPENSTVEYPARYLGGAEYQATGSQSPREKLADWMVAPDNQQFAATAVNRVWLHLIGRGLTESVDDLDKASAEERRILDELAKLFVASGYDLRWLITGICQSRLYQRECVKLRDDSAVPFAGQRTVKTLTPEQLYNSLEQALALPISRADAGPRYNGLRQQLLTRMNEAASNNPDEYKAGVPQALLLMNGRLTTDATDLEQSRTLRGVLDAPFLNGDAKLETLFLATFSRSPTAAERDYLMDHLQQHSEQAQQNQAYAEILWGLLNSPEFVLER